MKALLVTGSRAASVWREAVSKLYRLVEGSVAEIEEQVNALMREFWEPHGPPVWCGDFGIQPMRRRKCRMCERRETDREFEGQPSCNQCAEAVLSIRRQLAGGEE